MHVEEENDAGETPLSYAAFYGHANLAQYLLEKGASPHSKDHQGRQPLHKAARQGHEQILEILLENHADIEARDDVENTPLLSAARAGQRNTVRFLVGRGANPRVQALHNDSALHLAVDVNSRPLVRYLIEIGVEIEAQTTEGQTSLSRAVQVGHEDLVSLLLQSGANVDTMDANGWSPLHFVAWSGHEGILTTLLAYHPDLTLKTEKGEKALRFATDRGHNSVRKILEEKTSISLDVTERSRIDSIAELISAAEKGNVARVVQILDKGVDINATDICGRRAISYAAESGKKSVLQVLIDRKADLNLADTNGETALWWATRYGHVDNVRLLLSHGVQIDAADSDGQSPLSAAAQKGHREIVDMLLQKGSNPNTSVAHGKTALLFAALAGYPDVMVLLLRSGADASYKSPEGETALSLARSEKRDDCVKLLLNHGALSDVVAVEKKTTSDTPSVHLETAWPDMTREEKYHVHIGEAASKGRLAEVLRLLKLGAKVDGVGDGKAPILNAAFEGELKVVEALIEHSADINIQDGNGCTPLSLAAAHGHESVVQLLYDKGANIHQYDHMKRTALIHASSEGRQTVVKLLLQLGAELEWKADNGNTPLMCAVEAGHRTTVEQLIGLGANIECRNGAGCTSLNLAVRQGHRDIANLLLNKGAKMIPDLTWKRAPLSHAALSGFEGIVELLIDHGADLDYHDAHGMSALHLAVEGGHTMVVKILIEAGANVDLRNMKGRNAMSMAKAHGHESSIKLLSRAANLRLTNDRASKRVEKRVLHESRPYQYRPLQAPGYIRILELHPGNPGDILSIELNDVDLSQKPQFEALSYEWRDKFGTIPIQCSDQRILVSPNCKAAMEHLRLPSKPRVLWIDAICINQQDLQERNQQVTMMSDIYRFASAVLMWLGEDSRRNPTGAAFDSIPVMAQVHEMLREEPSETSFKLVSIGTNDDAKALAQSMMQKEEVARGFRELMWMPYFTRAWIFQEIILAGSRGIAICGRHQCPWRTLKAALVAYRAYSFDYNPTLFEIVVRDDWYFRLGRIGLSSTVRAMTRFDAGDPRDIIFATLGLPTAPERQSGQLIADYTLTTQEVFLNAARYFLDVQNGADIWDWRNRRSTKRIPNLPSWVPDFTQKPERLNVGPFLDVKLNFSELITSHPTTTMTSLHIRGCVMDRVAFQCTISKEMDVYVIFMSIVQALSKRARDLYDLYMEKVEESADPSTKSLYNSPETTNGRVMLQTILEANNNTAEKDQDAEIYSYLLWRLSKSTDTPRQSTAVPPATQTNVTDWETISQGQADFDLDICRTMDKRLRFGKDVILTEKGYFGLTNGGEAQEGMVVALVSGAENLCLLEENTDGRETWYEYVDVVHLRLLERIETREQITGEAGVKTLEIR